MVAQAAPDPGSCKKAIKILEQFERLAQKLGIKLSPKRIQDLKNLGDAIKSTDLPAKLRANFPGEFSGMSLKSIRQHCGKK
jgi:hypothetical protein